MPAVVEAEHELMHLVLAGLCIRGSYWDTTVVFILIHSGHKDNKTVFVKNCRRVRPN